jgi:prepilin-type N-terminal cleavage/methylation domain-containing protein
MRRHAHTHSGPRRGFTLLEILFSVLVIGMLLALLIGGVRLATRGAKETTQRQAARTIMVGISQFKREFNFLPPLVKDQHPQAAERRSVVMSGNTRRISIYAPAVDPDRDLLQGTGFTIDANNPFFDYRYSIRALPYYLAGGLGTQYGAGPEAAITIDGITGPGMYRPNPDGTFEVPRDVRSGSTTSGRVTASIEPLVNIGRGDLKLFVDPDPNTGLLEGDAAADPQNLRAVELRDINDVAIRYYRWEPEDTVQDPTDLNIPLMVARLENETGRNPQIIPTPEDRNLATNVKVKAARFAVVAAGPNKVFGDEPVDQLVRALGYGSGSPTPDVERRLRFEAEKDNIVEVGE